ncbi:hypothetical protein ACWXWB_22155 [Pantoea dispersa]|uniref:hypothetical protein n=1 Tax=Pantoea dispersa TaxID=59814 RepID=UPI0032121386
MCAFKNVSDTSSRNEVSSQELLSIMECDTYSESFLNRSFKSLGKDKVTAKDILDASAVDVDSRLHAFFALQFLTEKQSITTALKFIEQMLYLLAQQPKLLQAAENAISQLGQALNGDSSINMAKLEAELRELHAKQSQGRERLVFEALIRIFHLEARKMAEAVAGSARAAAAWNEDPAEEQRLKIANQQLDYLRTIA